MIEVFDTHTHLTDKRFDADRHKLVPSLFEQGVTTILDVADDVRHAKSTVELLDKYPFIFGSVGMHPHTAEKMSVELMDALKKHLSHKKMLALGEIGLDYHYDFSPREVQRKWFVEQLELAMELNLPVILHVREAFGDCMDILRAHRHGLRGVMHCFSGSKQLAFECIDLGLSIGLGGAVTFSNARRAVEVAQSIPLESLVIETDCPYMAPVPFRGQRNDPGLVKLVAICIARIRNLEPEQVAFQTKQNGLKLFGINA